MDNVCLILFDDNKQITIDGSDKNILATSCEYFKKLLTVFKEQFANEIKIRVPDGCCDVMRNIIMSFFNRELDASIFIGPTNSLMFIRCHDYFGIKMKNEYLNKLVIDDTNFELLLNIFKIDQYDDAIIKFVVEKIPNNFQIKLDKVLVDKILKLNRQKILSCSQDSIKIWEDSDKEYKLNKSLTIDKGKITCVTHSPDGKYIVSGSDDYKITKWDTITGKIIHTWSLGGSIEKIFYTTDGKKIITLYCYTTIYIWDAETFELLNEITADVMAMAVSPNNKLMASGGLLGQIILWDLNKCTTIWEKKDTNTITSLSFSPDSSLLVSVNKYGGVHIWDCSTGSLMSKLSGSDCPVRSVAFTPVGNKVVCGDLNGEIKLLDPKESSIISLYSNKKKSRFGRGTNKNNNKYNYIIAVSVSPDNTQIISGTNNGDIIIWDMATHKIIRTIDGHDHKLIDVMFLPDYEFNQKFINLL